MSVKNTIRSFLRCIHFRLKYRKDNVNIPFSATLLADAAFEGNNVIGEQTTVFGRVGFGTYLGGNSKIDADIGRFCSISWDVETLFGKHPFEKFVSTSPCFYSTLKQNGMTYVSDNLFQEFNYADPVRKKAVVIENDVWIGAHAKLCGGITIHNGASVLAGAVVTHDVPPYAIVGGVPAKIIRYRFPEDVIGKLMRFQWWDKGDGWLREHLGEMADIEKMVAFIDSETGPE